MKYQKMMSKITENSLSQHLYFFELANTCESTEDSRVRLASQNSEESKPLIKLTRVRTKDSSNSVITRSALKKPSPVLSVDENHETSRFKKGVSFSDKVDIFVVETTHSPKCENLMTKKASKLAPIETQKVTATQIVTASIFNNCIEEESNTPRFNTSKSSLKSMIKESNARFVAELEEKYRSSNVKTVDIAITLAKLYLEGKRCQINESRAIEILAASHLSEAKYMLAKIAYDKELYSDVFYICEFYLSKK